MDRQRRSIKTYGRKLTAIDVPLISNKPLSYYFAPMLVGKDSVTIADVGTGPYSFLGTYWPTCYVRVIACDIMADVYNELLREKGIILSIPVERQDMEGFTYRDCTFDIVHCVNALDHTTNPSRALREMYRICKPKGWVYLKHFPNEGIRQHYTGLHIWNIEKVEPDNFRIWNGQNDILASKVVKGFRTKIDKDGMIVSVCQRSR